MKTHRPLLLLLALSGPAHAASTAEADTPAQYSHAMPLQVSGRQGVVGFRLPVEVYQLARTPNLDDLRVFDANGVAQPFALYRPPAAAEQRSRLPARIFPVTTPAATGNAAFDLDIRTRADGSVIAVHARSQTASGNKAQQSLLLDFGPAAADGNTPPPRIDALQFTPATSGNYSAEVWLETSSDLKRWQTAGVAELRWLSNASAQTLASDRLEFSPQTFRYARLTWRRGEPQAFARIEAEALPQPAAEPARETLWIVAGNGKQAGELSYPAGIAIPVERVALRFSEANIVFPATLGSYVEHPAQRRAAGASEWGFQPRAQATFYQITQNDEIRRSGAIPLGGAHAQEWVIRPLGSSARPELGLSWQAATLVFLNGGTPPYLLSFGRADARAQSRPLHQVAPHFSAEELGRIEQARAGRLQAAPGNGSAASAAEQAAQRRIHVLWGVLLLGVAILGGLAWKLFRQLNAAPPPG